jgi:hypothetical protein
MDLRPGPELGRELGTRSAPTPLNIACLKY